MSPSAVVPGVKGEEDVVLTDVEPDPQLRPEPPVLGEDEPVGGQGEADVVALLLSRMSLNNVAIAFPIHILQIDHNWQKGEGLQTSTHRSLSLFQSKEAPSNENEYGSC